MVAKLEVLLWIQDNEAHFELIKLCNDPAKTLSSFDKDIAILRRKL